jgi:MFS family permease
VTESIEPHHLEDLVATQLMVALDVTIVNIALPHIQAALHFSRPSLAWVIDAYTLVFGGWGTAFAAGAGFAALALIVALAVVRIRAGEINPAHVH